MDIKLKRFSGNVIIRGLAFILCVVLFIATLVSAGLMSRSLSGVGDIEDTLWSKSYRESTSFQTQFDEKLSKVLQILNEYKSEEYIKSGKTIDPMELDSAIESLYYDGQYYNNSEYSNGYSDNVIYSRAKEAGYETSQVSEDGRDYNAPGEAQRFKDENADAIKKIQDSMMAEDLLALKAMKKQLDGIKGFTYYATDGTAVISNLDMNLEQSQTASEGSSTTTPALVNVNDFTDKPAYLVYTDGQFSKVPKHPNSGSSWVRTLDSQLQDQLDSEFNEKLTVYFAFDDDFISANQKIFENGKEDLVKWIPMIAISGILTLVLFIYLVIATGKKDEDGNRKLYQMDHIFTEIQLGIVGIAGIGGGAAFVSFLNSAFGYGYYTDQGVFMTQQIILIPLVIASLLGIGVAAVGLWFILACVRNIKAGRFFENSIIYRALKAVCNGIKQIYQGGSIMRKVILITLAICLLSATFFFAPVMIVLILIFAPKWVQKYEEIKKGVDEVKNGNLSYKIPVQGDSELDYLAKGINEISAASNLAIQNELKNQRLKTDLISNVSHDLKTPLTSIITYVDLLKKEGLNCADASKYLDILDQKSKRLQKLTEDLFDAAKASSGAIPVKFEKVEMLSLINQGLGEMSDKIAASNLEFKVNAEKDKYYVNGDGQLLWRVVENLLGNVLKYAQGGSRVYIDLREQKANTGRNSMVVMEIKNISQSELNIDADELLERFKRGDESRNTEGSGLGLAIAKDLVRLQNGWFEIKIDGDLFKAITMLEGYKEDPISGDE